MKKNNSLRDAGNVGAWQVPNRLIGIRSAANIIWQSQQVFRVGD